jgi:hypothetical protein
VSGLAESERALCVRGTGGHTLGLIRRVGRGFPDHRMAGLRGYIGGGSRGIFGGILMRDMFAMGWLFVAGASGWCEARVRVASGAHCGLIRGCGILLGGVGGADSLGRLL